MQQSGELHVPAGTKQIPVINIMQNTISKK